MISITNVDNSNDFMDYSWNYQSTTDETTKVTDTPFYVTMAHSYIDRCYLLSPFKPILSVLSVVYVLYSTVWIILIYKWKTQNFNI